MRIEAPIHFRHAGELRHQYPLLAQHAGSSSVLLIPQHMGVCAYLKGLGVFDLLKQHGVKVDDRGVRGTGSRQHVLELQRFDSESDVDRLADEAHERLQVSKLGAINLYPLVSEVFGELAMNAVQHSESPVGAFGFIQFFDFEAGQRFVCAVGDGGIGIKSSLERNSDLAGRFHYDWDAIELAVRERISSTQDQHRGIGLFGVAEDMRDPRHQLLIHSGQGVLEIREDVESSARRTTLFPGTLAYAGIPT